MYELYDLRAWAIEFIDKFLRNSIPAPHLFHLSVKYRVRKWLEPAYRTLVLTPLAEFKDLDIERMEPQHFVKIQRLKEKISEEVTLVAQCGPVAVMSIDSCNVVQHEMCERAWKEAWWLYVGWKIISPDPRRASPLTDARKLAGSIQVSPNRMSPECFKASVVHVQQLPEDAFLVVEQLMNGALSAFKYRIGAEQWDC